MASVPADIVHEFIFKSPRPSQGYDHDANVEPVSRVLSVLSLLDKGDWTITHTKARGTITFTLSWNGIRAGVLKDLEVTQVIKCTGQCYLKTGSSFNGYLFNLNHKASSTSRVDYLVKEGKVSLNLDHSGTTDQMHTGYESTATYTCTVSFARLSKVPQVMDQDSHAAKSAKIYLNIIDRQLANDVRFFFPSNNRELWANSTNLINASPYFRALLASDYEEGMKRTRAGHEENRRGKQDRIEIDGIGSEDSDDGRDEEEGEFVDPKGTSNIESNSTLTYHEVVISSTAYTTYKSILLWIHSSYINFAPLSSSSLHTMEEDVEESDHSAPADETLISASPKSVYRLAHLLDLPELCQLALDFIETNLTPSNVALDLFSNFSGIYDEVRKVEMDYFLDHYDEVKANGSMKQIGTRVSNGELAYYGKTSMELFEKLNRCAVVRKALKNYLSSDRGRESSISGLMGFIILLVYVHL